MSSEFIKLLVYTALETPRFTKVLTAEFLSVKFLAVICGIALAISSYQAFKDKAPIRFLWLTIASVVVLAASFVAYQFMFPIPNPSGIQRSAEFTLYFLVNLTFAFIVILGLCLAPAKLFELTKALFNCAKPSAPDR